MSRLLVEALFGQDVGFEERVQPEIQPLHRERREAFAQPEPFTREPDGGPVRRGPLGERALDIHPGDPGCQAIRALHPEVPEYEVRLQDRRPEEVPVVGSVHRSCCAVESGSGRLEVQGRGRGRGRPPGPGRRGQRTPISSRRRLPWLARRCRTRDTGYRTAWVPRRPGRASPRRLAGKARSYRRPPSGSRPATPAGPLPHRQAYRGLRVPRTADLKSSNPTPTNTSPETTGPSSEHAARVGHRIIGDRVGDHAFFGVRVAGVRNGVIYAGTAVQCAGISAAVSAVAHNTTSFPAYARRAQYREGVVGAPGKLVVLRIYGYRYDELVRVVSYGLGERLPKRTPAVGDYGSVRLQRDVRVITIPDPKRHATIAHGYGQVIALRRKLAVFGLYDDLVYPVDPRAIRKYVYNISRNEHISADSRSSRQGSFLHILRLGHRRCAARRRTARGGVLAAEYSQVDARRWTARWRSTRRRATRWRTTRRRAARRGAARRRRLLGGGLLGGGAPAVHPMPVEVTITSPPVSRTLSPPLSLRGFISFLPPGLLLTASNLPLINSILTLTLSMKSACVPSSSWRTKDAPCSKVQSVLGIMIVSTSRSWPVLRVSTTVPANGPG